ncbi:hypothetical protein KCV00_g10314, partial [Aureobasidium melanogenum]
MAAPTPHQQFIAQCQALYVQVNAFNTATPTLPISNALIQLQTIVNTYCNAINLPVQRRPIIHPHYISFPTLTNQNQYYTANPTSANIERPLNNTHAEFNTYITTTHPLPPTPGLLFCLISSLMTGGYHNPQTNWHTTALIFDPTPVLAPMPPTPAYIFNPGLAQSVPLAYNGLSTALPTPPTSIRVSNCRGGIRNLSLFTNLAPGNNVDAIPGTHHFTTTGGMNGANATQLRCVALSFQFLIRSVKAYLDPNPPANTSLDRRFSQGQGLNLINIRWIRLRP